MNKYSLFFLLLSRSAMSAISGIVANDWFDRETGKSVTRETRARRLAAGV